MAGYDWLGISCSSGGTVLVVRAFTTASNAGPATGGTTTVAVSKPRLTKACPVRGNPSTHCAHAPPGTKSFASSNAFLAPMAMESF
jgi:hypothetical protein